MANRGDRCLPLLLERAAVLTIDHSMQRAVDSTHPTSSGPQPAAPTVLLVEDDEDTRICLADLLEEHGYRVVPARNGREAQEYLATHPSPSCMVLDLWMPVMDGWALAAEVASGRLPGVPTMLITAAEGFGGYPLNPRYVLRKPLDGGKFLRMVDGLVGA
jgi:PleD family two-component response regulator